MAYFQNIHSLADLKKEYRRLALQHHPDKGGDTAVMQQVNIEFEKLFDVWKDATVVSASSTGYEYDYSGASAKEYAEYVYNEYRWKGRNYKGQHAPEIVQLVRTWLKETYPRYKFSVRRENYNSIYIKLMSADFEAFTKESGKVQDTINHYNIERNPDLTDRAKEVMMNVCDFVMSYNFDDSDAMTDYFHTNFYLNWVSAVTGSLTRWNCRNSPARERTSRMCSSIPKARRTRPCGRHWVRHGSASSNTGGISAR